MLNYYRTDDKQLHELSSFEPGCWIKATSPTLEECTYISERFEMDITDVRAALDDEESSRMSIEDDYTLILVDIPTGSSDYGLCGGDRCPADIYRFESTGIFYEKADALYLPDSLQRIDGLPVSAAKH